MSGPFSFRVLHEAPDGARTGELVFARGRVPTPAFMPVGTLGTVKSLTMPEVYGAGARMILGNTYHLYLRPGHDLVAAHGGLHAFADWPGPILTDSGGFQVYSLASFRKIDDDGVDFRSHLDGSLHRFTPEHSMAVQAALGADIAMAFDDVPPADAPPERVAQAMRRTTAWAARSIAAPRPDHQARFGIVQGGVHEALRREHAREITALPFDGFAVGGLSVGEPTAVMHRLAAFTAPLLPRDKPRYLMGVGHPRDLVACGAAGIDMFDCVLPTRTARFGTALTFEGPLTLTHARYRDDRTPVEPGCPCYGCTRLTRAYVRHLFQAKEMLGPRLLTLHNLTFVERLMAGLRAAVTRNEHAAYAADVARAYPADDPAAGGNE